jgi:imidazolonepropionase-like amidohydrolase
MKSLFLFLLLFFTSSITAQKQVVDLIIRNAKIYTVNQQFDIAESFAIKNDRIVAIGSNEEIFSKCQSKNVLDAKGKTILPGLIVPMHISIATEKGCKP